LKKNKDLRFLRLGEVVMSKQILINTIDDVIKRYENDWLIRTLVQLIPYGSNVETALLTTVNKMRGERIRIFFDELVNRKTSLSEKEIENKDFLYFYFRTVQYVMNTRRTEKVKLFAGIFNTYMENEEYNRTDEYEEMLSILDDLSFREFEVLSILFKYEKSNPLKENENLLQRATNFWDEFLFEVALEFLISKDEIPGILTRVNRTGLYQTFSGNYLGYAGNMGNLTPNFYKFIKVLGIVNK
jgi:hypothetical protein